VRVQAARLPGAGDGSDWLGGRRCLVAGLGPIGLLAAMALRRRGAEVYGIDVVDAGSARPRWLEAIGGRYVDGRQVTADKVDAAIGPVEAIVEATGVASLEFCLIDALARNGVYVLTGIPGGSRPIDIPGADLIRRLVLENLAMVGSVNASRAHFETAIDDLGYAMQRWPGLTSQLITHRHACSDFAAALATHPADEIKSVVEWGAPEGGTK
jgi:glucose 1-dehydrogenase